MALRNRYPNPFDRALASVDGVRVLVTPDAIDEMRPEEVELLAAIAGFEFLTIAFLSDDTSVAATLVAGGGIHATITESSRHIEYGEETSDVRRRMLLTSPQMADALGRGNADLPRHRWLDRVLTREDDWSRFDYIVVAGQSQSEHAANSRDRRICTFHDLVQQLRLVQIAQRNFELEPRSFVNHGLYYLYRRLAAFPDFQPLWFRSVGGADGIMDRVQSLGQRLDFACRALDLVLIVYSRTPDNDTGNDALYNLGYLFILATGAHDDLAFLSDRLFGLNLHRMRIALRKDARGSSDFRRRIASKSPAVANFLGQSATDTAIEGLYPIRDALQHRDFLQPIGMSYVVGSNGPNGVIIPLDSERLLSQFMPSTPYAPSRLSIDGQGVMVTYGPLAMGVFRALQHVVNGMVPLLIEHIDGRPRSASAQQHLDALLERWMRGPASFLKLGRAPLLL